MNEGWIKLYRKFRTWQWYKKSEMVHLFIHMLLSANHKEKKWQGVTIQRGQLITGRKTLSEETGISQQTIRTCLRRLEESEEINQQSTSKFSLITVCNYDDYQSLIEDDQPATNQQVTSNQPATNQQLTTNKNVKNIKNEKNIEIFKNVIDYLNKKTGKNFRHTTKDAKEKMNARLTDNYTEQDLLKVIDVKYSHWKDTDSEQFLTPATLFCAKHFDKYLNQDMKKNEKTGNSRDNLNCDKCKRNAENKCNYNYGKCDPIY